MQLTDEQSAVVRAKVSDLLVSAAAGSGKTAVMTERIVSRIVASQLEITDVLVMTFTEAAARQMKEKIAGKLDAARKSTLEPRERQRLSHQQTLLPGCAISTIHAFCLTVIRNFSHLAVDGEGQPLIEPGFSVSDPLVADLLLRESLDEVLTSRYVQIDRQDPGSLAPWVADFYRLVDSFSSSRSDDKLRQQIIQLYHRLRSMPDYREKTVAYRDDLAKTAGNFSQSRHADVLRGQLKVVLGQAISALPELLDLLDQGVSLIKDPVRNQGYHAQFRRIAAVLIELSTAFEHGQPEWNVIVDLAGTLGKLELPSLSGRGHSLEKIRLIRLFREQIAEAIHCLTGQCQTKTYRDYFLFDTRCLFSRPAAVIEQEIAEMLPVIDQLFELVLELDDHYRDRKREQSLVDFSDFEHLALSILRQPEAADYYRTRFREIYIDEYQDTSSIQEAILQAVGQNNIFMVGDVKQSIYRFRHARPRIFIERSNLYRTAGTDQLWTLSKNFRSVGGILEAVNEVFSQLMSVEAGEIDYDESQALVPHREPVSAKPPVELLLIDPALAADDEPADEPEGPAAGEDAGPDNADESDAALPGQGSLADPALDSGDGSADLPINAAELGQYEKEAIIVRQKIQQLLAEGHLPKDMAILARSRAIVRIFAAELNAARIAAVEDSGKALLDNPVMRLMQALLQVMDNPLQDVPLAAVMRSDLWTGSLSPQDLLAIRIAANQQAGQCRFFHEAVDWYAINGPDPELKSQVSGFKSWLDSWRAREKTLKTGEWLSLLLETSGYFGQVAASFNGTAQLKELRAFIAWIHTFEKNRRRGLFDLVRHLENLERNGIADAPYDFEHSEQDAVRVMTIHRSKGLEYPVVFVVGLAAKITPKDQQDPLMISESMGVGFDWFDPANHLRRTTHLKLAMLAENKAAALAEELRLLYVAMTRARDQLYLTAMLPKKGSKALKTRLDQARQWPDNKLPPHLVLSGRSYLEWLVLALARHPSLNWTALDGQQIQQAVGAASELETSGNSGENAAAGVADGGFYLERPTQAAWSLQIVNFYALAAAAPVPAVAAESPSTETPNTESPSTETLSNDAATGGGTTAFYRATQQLCQLLHPLPEADETLALQAERRISGAYRFATAARSPIKLSVSELKRREQDESLFGDDQVLGLPAPARGINLDLRPLQLASSVQSALDEGRQGMPARGAALGTLMHSFLRYLDLPAAQKAGTLAELERQLSEMAEDGIFKRDEASAIRANLADVLPFVQSDLARRMVAAEIERSQLYREMPFTLAIPAQEVFGGWTALPATETKEAQKTKVSIDAEEAWPEDTGFAEDDRALVQGMIDCWFQEAGAAVLIDYKTDRISVDPVVCRATLADRYSSQLRYYAQAIEAATRLPVHERIVVHLPSRQIYIYTAEEIENRTAGGISSEEP